MAINSQILKRRRGRGVLGITRSEVISQGFARLTALKRPGSFSFTEVAPFWPYLETRSECIPLLVLVSPVIRKKRAGRRYCGFIISCTGQPLKLFEKSALIYGIISDLKR